MSWGISPEPTDEEAAAIVAAIEMLTPRAPAMAPASAASPNWRLSGRTWWTRPGWPSTAV